MFVKNILLAFQLENYKNIRFIKFIYTHPLFWIFWSARQSLVWTKKILFILILGLFLFFIDSAWGIFFMLNFWSSPLFILPFILWEIFLLPLYFVIANIISYPLDSYLKNKIIWQATKKISNFKNLIVIGITGSYGKTSTKEMIYTFLSKKFTVLMTEGNKNTPLWVSEIILEKLNEDIEIFIVEMWAYIPWDIKTLCDIVKPKIGILTGITLQHLERFKSLENIIKTKFELIESLPIDWFALIDTSSQWVKTWLEKYKDFFAVKNIITISDIIPFHYCDNLEWINFEIEGKSYQTKLIAKHSLQTIQIAYKLAKYFSINDEIIEELIKNLPYTKHRMELIRNTKTGVNIIDDSYNGNIEWVKSIVDLLKNIKINGRKIIIVWWIIELGKKSKEVNEQLWKELANCADMILLSKWKIWEAILSWLQKANFNEKNIKIYPHSLDIHNNLWNILQFWDLIIFQNDLPDNYL